MATTKLFSQIATTVTAPAITDFFVGVQSGSTDVLYTQAQVNTSVSSALGLSSYTLTSALTSYAPLASPTFTGTVTFPTTVGTITAYAPLASPVFTGTVNAPLIVSATGSATSLSYSFSGRTNYGLYYANSTISFVTNGNLVGYFNNNNNSLVIPSGTIMAGGTDVSLGRATSGIAQIGNSGGGASGSLNLTNLTASGTVNAVGVTSSAPVYFPRYTVTSLPAATTGAVAIVTDALAPTFLGLLTGGGTSVTLVLYNGSAWTVT
jgi:hypothetical protein